MATVAAASIPQDYDRIRPGFVSELAADAKVEHDDYVALLTKKIAPVAARDGPHGAGLERFDIPLLTRTAEHVNVQKAGIDADVVAATKLLVDGKERVASHLAAVTERGKEELLKEAKESRNQEVSKLTQKSAHLKALVHQTTGMKAILAERAKAGRCQQTVGQMSPEQEDAEYQLEEKFRIHERDQACQSTAAALQKSRGYWASLEKIKGERAVCAKVDVCIKHAKDRLSAVDALVAERQQHIQSSQALETELSKEFERAKEAEKQAEAAVRDLLERLLAANKVHRAARMRKHMVSLSHEALRENIKKEEDEMKAVVHAKEVADAACTKGLADIEELRKGFLTARESAGRAGVAHVQPAALEDALSVSLAHELVQRSKSSKEEERHALHERKGDVERQLAEAIRRRDNPATASEEARRKALRLPDDKTELEKSIQKCDEDSRVLNETEKAGKEVRRQLNDFSEFGLGVPWKDLERQAQTEADACFEKFPGLFKRGDRSQTREPVALPASTVAEGQLALLNNHDIMAQLEQLVERRVKEQLARDRNQRKAARAAKRRAQEASRASASSPRTESSLGSWEMSGEPRFTGEEESGSSSVGGFDD